MMATFFSQHSSNPLEVSSSDVHNTRRLRMLEACGGVGSSDEDYTLTHSGEGTASGWTAKTVNIKESKEPVPLMIDLDEDMSDEDTLACDTGMGTAGEADADAEEEEEEETQVDEQVDDEDEEERTILLKPPDEQEQIAEEILDLEEAVPQLREDYKIVDRLGTGTFSSVYKAIDLWYHTKWYNTPWLNVHPPTSPAYYQSEPRPKGSKAFVAIKRIYVTSGPDRIRNEISIMDDCRGCRHVSQLVTAFRHRDQIVVVMPYHKNDDFRDYYRDLPLEGVKSYLRCLFRALRDVHSRGVIHRDIKPANFLFDPRTGTGTLCDFGLACRMTEGGQKLGACLHTCASPEYPHGRVFTSSEYDRQGVRKAQKDARERSRLQTERVGYPEKDTRPNSKANRAGTRGFRAPEVLFKCGLQSGAIDVWSAGIILLFFLTRKFPLFQSNDDVEALMELSTILGRKGMERTATLHSRTFSTNVPSIPTEGMTWSQFVEKLNPNLMVPKKESSHFYPHCKSRENTLVEPPLSSSPFSSHSSSVIEPVKSSYRAREWSPSPIVVSEETHKAEIALALDLLEKMLNPDATKRIQPRNALGHPFLSEEAEGIYDDDSFPHGFGGGVCGDLHYYDEDTGDACVQLPQKDGTVQVRRVLSGEGLAIGNSPSFDVFAACYAFVDYRPASHLGYLHLFSFGNIPDPLRAIDHSQRWLSGSRSPRDGITYQVWKGGHPHPSLTRRLRCSPPCNHPNHFMRHQNGLQALLIKLQPLAPQILPFLVIPIFTIVALRIARSSMLSALFNWSSSRDSSTSHESQDRKKLKKKGVRTRAEQLASPNGDARTAEREPRAADDGYYPGLINMSGTYCFMNSVVQALASLSYLRPQIEDIHARAVILDVETPVIDPLRDLLHALNMPRSSPKAIKPIQLINALSIDPEGRTNPLLCSREHQDAQELFQLLSECIKREATTVDKEGLRDRGLGAMSNSGLSRHKSIGSTVFDGLTANRRSCVVCGYTEAVMHFSFDNWQLAVPRAPYCTIYDCLFDYTRLEKLTDCICRMCSMVATHQKLLAEAERVTALMTIEPNPSPSRKKRVKEARKLEGRVRAAIEEGRIEEDIPGVKLEKVYSKESTKQVMIARTPHVLTLHLNRSVHFGHYASKNTCQVDFPEILNLSPFATSGQLSTKPDHPISSHQLHQPAPSPSHPQHLTLYQLSAVVCHYGQHSFGHYICYRRKPRPVSAGTARFSPPKLPCPLDCRCERCMQYGFVRVDDGYDNKRRPGCGWLRISDDAVQEVGFETVALEGSSVFMLFYEKVLQPRASPTSQQVTGEPPEAVKPNDPQPKEPEPVHEGDARSQDEASASRTNDVQPRVVRNVSTRRTESPAPQSKTKPSGSQVSTPHLMRGGSYFSAQAQQLPANGHVRTPGTTSGSWYRPASPPPTPREPRQPPPSSSNPHSPSKSQSRVPVPSTTAMQYQPQRLQI